MSRATTVLLNKVEIVLIRDQLVSGIYAYVAGIGTTIIFILVLVLSLSNHLVAAGYGVPGLPVLYAQRSVGLFTCWEIAITFQHRVAETSCSRV